MTLRRTLFALTLGVCSLLSPVPTSGWPEAGDLLGAPVFELRDAEGKVVHQAPQ